MNKQAVMSFASPLAGKFVKRAPLIAGNAPLKLEDGTVPLKLVAVTTPVACTPEVT